MNRLSIGTKLTFLAGVPVIGALILAGLIAQGARTQAETAAALGSVGDVAQLSIRISAALHGLQMERARVALAEGFLAKREGGEAEPAPDAVVRDPRAVRDAELARNRQFAVTDASLRDLERFLAGRDLSRLPARLAGDLNDAQRQVVALPAFRERVRQDAVSVDDILSFYATADDALISATSALRLLSDDGQLLRPISALVALAELEERGSRQHALLSFIFAHGEFPPGAFKTLVTLVTEQSIYANSFLANVAGEGASKYTADQKTAEAQTAIRMRDAVVAATDDSVSADAGVWFTLEAARLERVGDVGRDIVARVSSAAAKKMAATQSSIHTSIGLSLGVVLSSAILAWVIARGITRTVGHLSSAAEHVRKTKDFSARAKKTSSDELGTLTDAFNEMLSDIQRRDGELEAHRTNLEDMVRSRTTELVARTEAMRLVLDNVDQGLTTVAAGGGIDKERSAAFDAWFGVPEEGASFAAHLGGNEPQVRQALESGWSQVIEDFLPIELTIDQLPKRIVRDGRHFTLRFKPILAAEQLSGALLVVSDVTEEVEARAEQEKQREYIAVFERVTHDREGFIEFAVDTNRLLRLLAGDRGGTHETMMTVHTIKGNTAQWGIASVAKIAHEMESKLVEAHEDPTPDEIQALVDAWECVADRFRSVLGETNSRVEVTRAEVDRLLQEIRARIPHEDIMGKLELLKHEPTALRFERMVSDVERLAARLGKPRPRVVIEHNDVRLPASRFAAFWSSTVHLIRNTLDHGLESADGRTATGKPTAGTLTFRSVLTREHFRLEFADDGRGIDWEKVAAKAAAMGLPVLLHADLERALFATGVSTADAVTELSGRGVGLSAVAARCHALGGTVSVESTLGRGAKFVFSFPRRGNEHSLVPPAARGPSRDALGSDLTPQGVSS